MTEGKKEITPVYPRLSLPNDIQFLPLVMNFIQDVAQLSGFPESEIRKIQLATEEAVSNVIKHAFNPDDQAEFHVICEKTPLGLKTIIKDKGLPFDPTVLPVYNPNDLKEDKADKGLGLFLMKQFMDEVSIHNLGREGKEIHLLKYQQNKILKKVTLNTNRNPGRKTAKTSSFPPKSIPFYVRKAKPQETVEISKCAYDAYDYSYGHEHIYYPDRLRKLIENATIISAVAVSKDPKKTILAHNALIFADPRDKIAEMGMAFTKKKYQNQGCSRKLGIFLLKEAIKKGLLGILLDCTTAHIYSQKAAIGAGARECCILLGIDPQAQSWKHFASQGHRISNIIAYKKVPLTSSVNKLKGKKDIFAPKHHEGIIKKIYNNLNIKPNFREHADNNLDLSQALSVIEVHTGKSYQKNATIEIKSYGLDLIQQLNQTIKNLCLDKIEVIYILLNLENPKTAHLTQRIESLGFFFAGIIPGADTGDKLELQYLNNILIDYEQIQLYSSFSKELLAYIQELDPNKNN